MTKQSDHDLLIEIAAVVKRMEEKQTCDTNKEKIKTLERLTWGTLLTAITATIRAFWPGS